MKNFASNLGGGSMSCVIVTDTLGIIRSLNDCTVTTFGYSRAELIGQNIKILMSDDNARYHDDHIRAYMRGDKRSAFLEVVQRSALPVLEARHKDGHPVQVTVSLSRSPLEGAVLFAAIIEALPLNFVKLRCDAQGTIPSASGSCAETLGHTRDQLRGASLSLFCALQVHSAHRFRNAQAVHRLGHLVPICLELERSVTQNKEYTANIVEIRGPIEAVFTVSRDGLVQQCSGSCTVMFGYECRELIGHSFSNLTSLTPKLGTFAVMLRHKDGSEAAAKVDIQSLEYEGQQLFKGTVKLTSAQHPQDVNVSADDDESMCEGDNLGWYQIGAELGRGYFGSVKSAVHRLTGVRVAIKCLKKESFVDTGLAFPPVEVALLTRLNHPNIIRLFDVIQGQDRVWMVMEEISSAELFDYLLQEDHLSEYESCVIFRQLVSAVEYMHRAGVVHRDLKIENLLYEPRAQRVTVIDLGLGSLWGQRLLSTFCGSADYASPEMYMNRRYRGPEVDVWSLGVVLYLMATGYIPFNSQQDILRIGYSWPPEVHVSAALRHLVSRIFTFSEERISMGDIMRHPFLLKAGGRLDRFPPVEPYGGAHHSVDPLVLQQMVALGFQRQDVESSVSKERNQLSTTYNLLKSLKSHEHPAEPPEAAARAPHRALKRSRAKCTIC